MFPDARARSHSGSPTLKINVGSGKFAANTVETLMAHGGGGSKSARGARSARGQRGQGYHQTPAAPGQSFVQPDVFKSDWLSSGNKVLGGNMSPTRQRGSQGIPSRLRAGMNNMQQAPNNMHVPTNNNQIPQAPEPHSPLSPPSSKVTALKGRHQNQESHARKTWGANFVPVEYRSAGITENVGGNCVNDITSPKPHPKTAKVDDLVPKTVPLVTINSVNIMSQVTLRKNISHKFRPHFIFL